MSISNRGKRDEGEGAKGREGKGGRKEKEEEEEGRVKAYKPEPTVIRLREYRVSWSEQ